MDYSTPGFPVLHYLPEFAQTHIHWVNDAIQPSHPLLPASSHALNLSYHQESHQKSVLRIRWPKYWSFSFSTSPSNEYSRLISFRIDWFDLLVVQGTLKVFSSTTVWKHQFFGTQPSLWSNSHICTWLLERPQLWLYRPLPVKWCFCFFIHCLVLSKRKKTVIPTGQYWFISPLTSSITRNLFGWWKSLFGFFCKILWKNPNEPEVLIFHLNSSNWFPRGIWLTLSEPYWNQSAQDNHIPLPI